MGIVGVKSTTGREVKFVDPSMTTRGESAWLGYLLCDIYNNIYTYVKVQFIIFLYMCYIVIYYYYYNEERRLGVQRGSDTLVVPLFTSNDGLSSEYIYLWEISLPTYKKACSFSEARHSFACLVEGYFLRFALCLALASISK